MAFTATYLPPEWGTLVIIHTPSARLRPKGERR